MAPFFLNQFESYLSSEKRFSLHTITAYMHDLKQFLNFTLVKEDKDLKEINYQTIRGWIVDLNDKEFDNKSINRKISTLRTFFSFALKSNLIEKNPILKIVGPKQSKRLPVFVKESEIKVEKMEELFAFDEVLNSPEEKFEILRDKLMFELFYQTGIRLNELIELTESNCTDNSIKVLGKRNKERIIPISENLTKIIHQYKSLKNKVIGLTSTLFCLNNGNKLYAKLVYRKINCYLSLVTSLEKRSPHILRHTFATHMLNNGAGLETLKNLLGHSSLAATQVYTHNSFAQLTHIYSSAHPRGHKKD